MQGQATGAYPCIVIELSMEIRIRKILEGNFCTVVHPNNRVGTLGYDAVPPLPVHVKTLLRVHTVSLKRDYCWKFVVCLQSSILHPKNTKFGKSDIFRCPKIA